MSVDYTHINRTRLILGEKTKRAENRSGDFCNDFVCTSGTWIEPMRYGHRYVTWFLTHKMRVPGRLPLLAVVWRPNHFCVLLECQSVRDL